MVDQYFGELVQGEMLWAEALPVNQSAFVQYTNRPIEEPESKNLIMGSNYCQRMNMNKKMIEFLRRSWTAGREAMEPDRRRCYRHMISERTRREKQKQSYLALHSLLPCGTKNEKNSIIRTAALEIQELQRLEAELKRRNRELQSKLAAQEEERQGVVQIRLRVPNPTSGIDSMVEVLKCLRNLGLKTKTIQSGFSAQEFSAVLEIETMMIEAAEVEKVVQKALFDVEGRRLRNFHEGWRG